MVRRGLKSLDHALTFTAVVNFQNGNPRVAAGQEMVREKQQQQQNFIQEIILFKIFFKVREKSGNFILSQGKLNRTADLIPLKGWKKHLGSL